MKIEDHREAVQFVLHLQHRCRELGVELVFTMHKKGIDGMRRPLAAVITICGVEHEFHSFPEAQAFLQGFKASRQLKDK